MKIMNIIQWMSKKKMFEGKLYYFSIQMEIIHTVKLTHIRKKNEWMNELWNEWIINEKLLTVQIN